MNKSLFPIDLRELEWVEFPAEGFSQPVCGVIYRKNCPPTCGMPLGVIDTGCIDLESNGTFGYCSIFNSLVPRRGPLNLPFLGISAGKRTWVLTTGEVKGVQTAEEIHYWAHYPVVDLEYDIEGPVSVGLRAWAPFFPGDIMSSTIPGAVFEVHLRNAGSEAQKGTVAFSFPGPSEAECGGSYSCKRKTVEGKLNGVVVEINRENLGIGYTLGVVDQKVRRGGEIGIDGGKWSKIGDSLPPSESNHLGTSLAVDFKLQPMESKVVRFILSWCAPYWQARGSGDFRGVEAPQFVGIALKPTNPLNPEQDEIYAHMYAKYHPDSLETARQIAEDHQLLLKRIFAWQEAIYTDGRLPIWLRESLVNVLHLITEDGLWAQGKPPIGDWCRPEDGIFAMCESPRSCPQMECIPCSLIGNSPLVYFFPELALSTLRAYKGYQYPDGQAPWCFGAPCEMTNPQRGLKGQFKDGTRVKPQVTLDGSCYVAMVDRFWLRTQNREILKEFYSSVKKNTIFTMNLRPGSGPAGIISMPADNFGWDWYEHCDIFGMSAHVGGVHLANLRMAERMALEMGDKEFAGQCQEWFNQGSRMLEEHMWAGQNYLFYNEFETGKKSDMLAAFQLDGEWMAVFHGLPGVFPPDKVKTTLETIKQTSMALTDKGVVVFINPDGSPIETGSAIPGEEGYNKVGYWGAFGVATPATLMLAMTYMYNGEKEVGLELARRFMHHLICEKGWTWDMPVFFWDDVGETRERGKRCGTDYYQNMLLWSLPAAMEGTDFRGPTAPGGLVDRVIRAAKSGHGETG